MGVGKQQCLVQLSWPDVENTLSKLWRQLTFEVQKNATSQWTNMVYEMVKLLPSCLLSVGNVT